jgi:hypothetical protein
MKIFSEPIPSAVQSDGSSAGLGTSVQSPLTFGLVLCGGVVAVLFTVIYLLEGITRPGYNGWQQPISALSLGPGGWVQQASFILFGVLQILSAVGWYRFLTPGRGGIWFALFQGLSGLGPIGAGLFSMDPFPGYPPGNILSNSTLHGTLHTICAYTIIISLVLSCFTLSARLWSGAHWRGWAVYSAISGVLMLILWEIFVQYPTSPSAGLVERLSAGSHDLWMCALLVTLLFHNGRHHFSR